MPRSRAAGCPSTELIGWATSGPSRTVPAMRNSEPNSTSAIGALPTTPQITTATPTAVQTAPVSTRPFDTVTLSAADSRSAATGATREARTAGATAATVVTIVPTARPVITVVGVTIKPVLGRSNP